MNLHKYKASYAFNINHGCHEGLAAEFKSLFIDFFNLPADPSKKVLLLSWERGEGLVMEGGFVLFVLLSLMLCVHNEEDGDQSWPLFGLVSELLRYLYVR